MKSRNNETKIISKTDIILFVAILSVCLIGIILIRLTRDNGYNVNIMIGGELKDSYKLNKNQEFDVVSEFGNNHVVILDGYVYVSNADCPDKVCVEHYKISKDGETIICLPHKLVIEVTE